MEARYLTIEAACGYLSVTRNTLNRMVDEGLIPKPIRMGPRLIRFDREEIDQWLDRAFMESKDETGGGNNPISEQ